MEEFNVRIVRLGYTRVISTHGFGESPEGVAWDRLIAWLKQDNHMQLAEKARFFGFNNPNPTPGSPNYGYEQWMTIPEDFQVEEGDVRVAEFTGGLYGVAHCDLSNITEVWQKLAAWREDSPYKPAYHACVEECLTPPLEGVIGNLEFDLYVPIAE
jgi:DNA gyrase inhibitor GyrI